MVYFSDPPTERAREDAEHLRQKFDLGYLEMASILLTVANYYAHLSMEEQRELDAQN
jgi:hypothetical protein